MTRVGCTRAPAAAVLALALAALLVALAAAPAASAQLFGNSTTLAKTCSANADCTTPGTFCDRAAGVCALRACATGSNTALACSLFNSTSYCSSAAGGRCLPKLLLDEQCSPGLEVAASGGSAFSLPSIPGVTGNTTQSSDAPTPANEQCTGGLRCDSAQGKCVTDGFLGLVRYSWNERRGVFIAAAIGIVLVLFCGCACAAYLCGCAACCAVSAAGGCVKSILGCLCGCCMATGKKAAGAGGKASSGGAYGSHQPVYDQPPPAQPAPHASSYTLHELSTSNSARPQQQQQQQQQQADSGAYAGKIVTIETEHIVQATPAPTPAPATPAPAPFVPAGAYVQQQPVYATTAPASQAAGHAMGVAGPMQHQQHQQGYAVYAPTQPAYPPVSQHQHPMYAQQMASSQPQLQYMDPSHHVQPPHQYGQQHQQTQPYGH